MTKFLALNLKITYLDSAYNKENISASLIKIGSEITILQPCLFLKIVVLNFSIF